MMMIKHLLFCLAVTLVSRCSNDQANPIEVDCAAVLCTAEFVSISIEVQDRDGVQVPLDDFRVNDTVSGEKISRDFSQEELEGFRQQGKYPIYDDSYRDQHLNKERRIRFTGIIDGQEIVAGDYVVGADCCHVHLVSGNKILRVDN